MLRSKTGMLSITQPERCTKRIEYHTDDFFLDGIHTQSPAHGGHFDAEPASPYCLPEVSSSWLTFSRVILTWS